MVSKYPALRIALVYFLLSIGTLLLPACGSEGGGNNRVGWPSRIGPNGGIATSSDGRASVNIPAGSLSHVTEIAVAIASNPVPGNIDAAYDFGPSGTLFSQPVTVSITYDDATLVGVTESNLRLGTVANNQWVAVTNSTVDTVANVVSGSTTHFSVFGVIAVSDSGVAPAAPTGVTVDAGDGQVTVTWEPVSDATSYNVYMAAQAGVTKTNFGNLLSGMQHTNVTAPFNHTGLANGTTYYFVVTAVNASGESTESNSVSATPTALITHPLGTAAITAGDEHSCALAPSGSIKCWGANAVGQLGNGSVSTTDPFGELVPTPVVGVTDAVAVSAGGQNTCAILSDRSVACWGSNQYGELGQDAAVPYSGSPIAVAGVLGADAIAVGNHHICALLTNKSVTCWGGGELTSSVAWFIPPTAISGITTARAIAAGGTHTCAILDDGTTTCWDVTQTGFGGPGSITGISTAAHIALGFFSGCVALVDGRLQCWTHGSTTSFEATGVVDVVDVASGGDRFSHPALDHTCAVLSDGHVQCWGTNFFGELGDGNSATFSFDPTPVSGIFDAVNVVSGSFHTCVRRQNGAVLCWGLGSKGQLGQGTTSSSSAPVSIELVPLLP